MAHARRIAIDGKLHHLNGNRQYAPGYNITKNNREDLVKKILEDLEWLEKCLNGEVSTVEPPKISRNFVDLIHGRQLGHQHLQGLTVSEEYGTKLSLNNNLLKEREFKFDTLNKVFCSSWLNDSQILFGTKCNKLIVLDIYSKKVVKIPSLKSSQGSIPPKNPCGIHSLQINPSRSLVATGALNSNDVAVYKLPTLDPLFVGEGGHSDWIFDITWLDDEFFVSGSRDTTLALWRVKEDSSGGQSSLDSSLPSFNSMKPLSVKNCKNAEKVRALLFNNNYQELVALSLNAYLHLWDAQTFKQKFSKKLPYSPENVCIAQQLDLNLYAVGSRSHITLLDNKTLIPERKIPVPTNYQSCGIRSLSFLGDILTIGSGVGKIFFYDVRASKYLDPPICKSNREKEKIRNKKLCSWSQNNLSEPLSLTVTRGTVHPDEQYNEFLLHMPYTPAIYTHCYDNSGTRLFAAGGPLPASLQGNYAGLFL